MIPSHADRIRIRFASCGLRRWNVRSTSHRDDPVATLGTGTALDAAGVRSAVGLASANLDTQIGTLATAANLATVAGYLDTEIAAILEDTNELQTDWVNGGRLDLLIDEIKEKTDNLPSDPADQSAVEAAITAAVANLALEATAQSILTDTAEIGAAGAGLTALATQASVDALENISVADVLAGVCDTGVSLAKVGEMIAALAAGKVSASSSGGVTTLTYKKRDGSTTSFTVVVTESDNTRATTGALS